MPAQHEPSSEPGEKPAGTAAGPAGPAGLVERSIEEFGHQLRAFTDRAKAVAGAAPGKLPLPPLPRPPGAMSAAQLTAIARSVSAQRQSIAAMRAQLDAFDQHLAVLEGILDPLVKWSSTWARVEEAVGDLVRRDGPDTSEGPSGPVPG